MGGNGEVNTKRWKLKFEIICCFYLKGRVLQTVNSSFELTIAVAGLDLFRKKKTNNYKHMSSFQISFLWYFTA